MQVASKRLADRGSENGWEAKRTVAMLVDWSGWEDCEEDFAESHARVRFTGFFFSLDFIPHYLLN